MGDTLTVKQMRHDGQWAIYQGDSVAVYGWKTEAVAKKRLEKMIAARNETAKPE